MNNTDPPQKHGCNQVIAKGKQFLLLLDTHRFTRTNTIKFLDIGDKGSKQNTQKGKESIDFS